MKKYILPLMSIAMLMAMASCSSSDDEVAEIKEESKLVPMTFTATQESNVGTRTALSTGNSVIWKTGDMISVFDGNGEEGNHQFSLTGDASLGKFSGIASSEATSFTAVYPYTEGAQLESDGSVSGITLPAEQTATPNSFDPKAALMMAYTEDKSQLNFKNVVSLVKVTTDFDCKSIVLTAKENIAGTGKLTYNSGAPAINFTSNISQTVTLKPASEDGVIAAGTYYIAVCPHASSGFSIRFINSADTKAYTQTSIQSNTFNRSKIKNLGTFSESGTSWTSTIEKNGNVNASQQIDLGLTITGSDSKQYRVIFAKSNLTANGLAENEYDYGDYFAWGAREPWYSSATQTWKEDKPYGYILDNTPFYDSSTESYYTKYTSDGETLEASDDAARQILKDDWQLPTKEIWVALYNTTNYDWVWTTQVGYNGCKVTSKSDNSKSIFLPAAGYVNGTKFQDVGSCGRYWSGTAGISDSTSKPYILRIKNGSVMAQVYYSRYFGLPVRPVRLVEVSQSQQ